MEVWWGTSLHCAPHGIPDRASLGSVAYRVANTTLNCCSVHVFACVNSFSILHSTTPWEIPIAAPVLAPVSSAGPAASSSPRRPEIQGLRGLAVVLVVAFHLWGSGVSGGVDVFFVVSAYLLTMSFARKAEEGRPLALVRYWSRTFVRLLIPVAIALLAVLVAILAFYPASRWDSLWTQLFGAATYSLNWVLAAASVDYYAGGGVASSPVQHMWSLAVQGQVFVLWPLVIAVALGLSKATGRRFRPVAIGVFGLVLAVSLTASVIVTPMEPGPAYFHTGLRLWEFALGSLAALIFTSRLSRRVSLVLGWGGFAAVVLAGFVVCGSGLFPGWAALMPTLGAVALLISRDGGGRRGVHVPLSWSALTWLGDRSYGIYLWHWPLMITWLLLSGAQTASLGAGLLIFAASVVLTLGTERAVVRLSSPQRARARASTRKELVRLAAIVATVTVPVSAAQAWTISQSELQASYEVTPENYPGAAAAIDGAPEAPDLRPVPLWSEVDDEWGDPGGEVCESKPEGFDDSAECYVYDPAAGDGREAQRTVVLLGDSHAKQLSEPLKIAAENRDWRLVTFVYAGCRYTGHDDALPPECNDFNRAAEAAVLELDPDAVIAQGTRSQMPDQDQREIVVPQWSEGVAGFQEAGIPVVSVRDNPRWGRDMFECVDLYGEDSHLCGDPVDEALGGQAIEDQWADENPEVPLVDLTDLYCPDGHCGPTVGNVMIYRDLDHVTAMFGRTTAPMLEQRLVDALGW